MKETTAFSLKRGDLYLLCDYAIPKGPFLCLQTKNRMRHVNCNEIGLSICRYSCNQGAGFAKLAFKSYDDLKVIVIS